MDNEIDMRLKETIENWGIPECLQNHGMKVVYKFQGVPVPANEYPYHCKHESAKFCLFDFASNTILFTMEFYHLHKSFINQHDTIKLELMVVHNHKLRGQGIASYYLDKLIDYAKSNRMDRVKIVACTRADPFKKVSKINALSQKRLVEFYKSHATQEMPIEILEC